MSLAPPRATEALPAGTAEGGQLELLSVSLYSLSSVSQQWPVFTNEQTEIKPGGLKNQGHAISRGVVGVNRILGFLERFRSAYPDYVNATLWLAQTLARPPAPDRERIVALYAEQIRRIRSRRIPEGDRLEEKVSISFGEFYSGYLKPRSRRGDAPPASVRSPRKGERRVRGCPAACRRAPRD